jgi:hypothetical protein
MPLAHEGLDSDDRTMYYSIYETPVNHQLKALTVVE